MAVRYKPVVRVRSFNRKASAEQDRTVPMTVWFLSILKSDSLRAFTVFKFLGLYRACGTARHRAGRHLVLDRISLGGKILRK